MTLFGKNPLFEERDDEDLNTAIDRIRVHIADTEKIKVERVRHGVDFSRPSLLEDPQQDISPYTEPQTAGAHSIAASTDRDDPGFFERVVADPGRFAHQLVSGFRTGAAELVELPEIMANAAIQALGGDEDDKLRLLHNLSNHIRDGVEGDQAPEWWADKVAYYTGYMIPDIVGIVLGGAGGIKAAQTLTKLSPKLMVHSELVTKLGRVAGVVGYGTVKGGAFGGAEGAKHGAAQFTMMEAAGAVFGGFNLPARVLANAAFMSGVTMAQYDMSAPDWEDEVIASGILGGAFGVLNPHAKQKLLTNGNNFGKTKAWAAKRRLQGERVGLNDHMMEFLGLETETLSAARDGESPKGFKKKLRDQYENHTGEAASPDDLIFTRQLSEFFSDGEVPLEQAKPFAEGIVRVADVFEKPLDYLNDPFIGDFIEAHGSKIWFDRGQGPTLIETHAGEATYTDVHGVEYKMSHDEARYMKEQEVTRALEERKLLKIADKNLIEEKGWRGLFDRWSKTLWNPQGKEFHEIAKLGAEGKEVTRTLDRLAYGAKSWADRKVNDVWRRTGIDKLSAQEMEDWNALMLAGKWEDVHLRDQAKGKERSAPQTLEQAQLEQKVIWNSIKERGGQAAVEKMERMIGAFEAERTKITEETYKAGLITKSTRDVFLRDKSLGRQARYTRAKAIHELETKLDMMEQAFYKESLSAEAVDKYLAKHRGELMVKDAMLLWEQEIRAKTYMIARNDAIRAWADLASKHGEGLAYAAEAQYDHIINGKIVDKTELQKALDHNAMIDAAHEAKRARVQEKEASRQRLVELELEEAMLRESTGEAPEGTFLEAERQALEGIKLKKRPGEKDFKKLQKEVDGLYKEIDRLVDKAVQIEDWSQGDFSRYDVPRPKLKKAPTEIEKTREYLKLERTKKELLEQAEHYREETRKIKIERRLKPMEGFIPVQYLEAGRPKTLMIAQETAGLLNLGQSLGKDQSAILRNIGIISGATPVRLLATATNSVFALRSVHRDLMHFWTADTLNKTGPIGYMKDFLRTSPDLLKDVAKKGDRYRAYVDAGGSEYTRSLISAEDTMLLHAETLYKGAQSKTRKFWEKAIHLVSRPNDIMEVAVRTYVFEHARDVYKMNPKDAAHHVNQMLNFSRKGNTMRYMDAMIPFLNVATQALAAQGRAARANPKLYAAKMGTYWGTRMILATAAYMAAPEIMDAVSPRSKVGNVIIPVPLTFAPDENGDRRYPYIQVPVEKNPITGMLDSMLFGALDIMRDKDNLGDWQDVMKMYWDNYDVADYAAAGLGPDAIPPAMSALMAMYRNRDPRTGDNIWRGSTAINMAARVTPDTSRAAQAFGALTGAAPVGVERAVQAMTANNMYTGFMGWLLHGVTHEEKQSMSYAVTEAMPGLSNMVKWTRPDTSLLRMIRQDNATHKFANLTLKVRMEIDKIKRGELGVKDAIRDVKKNKEWSSLERKDAMDMILRNTRGMTMYDKVRKSASEEVLSSLPSTKEFQLAAMSDVKTRAKWWLSRAPERGTEEFKAFNRIGIAYFGNSNKFNYWRRQYSKDPNIR